LIGINARQKARAYPSLMAGRILGRLGVMTAGAFLLAACASQPIPGASSAPGFLKGLLHGFFALPALVGSVFLPVRVYAFPNSGFGYELGFVLGFGGSNVAVMLSLIARIGGYLVRRS
jgi:hypothetical protein